MDKAGRPVPEPLPPSGALEETAVPMADVTLMLIQVIGGTTVQQGPNALAGIVPPGAEVEQVATGFQFTEGPAWGPDDALYFSDIPADTICRLCCRREPG